MSPTRSTSFKAFAFGIGGALAVALSLTHVQEQRERAASVVTLEPVVIEFKRVPASEIQQLPTVYISGRRASAPVDVQLALADRTASCSPKLC